MSNSHTDLAQLPLLYVLKNPSSMSPSKKKTASRIAMTLRCPCSEGRYLDAFFDQHAENFHCGCACEYIVSIVQIELNTMKSPAHKVSFLRCNHTRAHVCAVSGLTFFTPRITRKAYIWSSSFLRPALYLSRSDCVHRKSPFAISIANINYACSTCCPSKLLRHLRCGLRHCSAIIVSALRFVAPVVSL